MTDKEWLECARKFYMGESPSYRYAHGPGREVYIEDRAQIDDSVKWIVKMDNWCLGKDNEYHYEPRPSERSDAFIDLTRFDSREEAYKAWIKHEAAPSAPTFFMP